MKALWLYISLVFGANFSFCKKHNHGCHNQAKHWHHGGHGSHDESHHHDHDCENGMHDVVQDKRRDCPLGFFYAGEVPEVETRGEIWSMGETSPVYSCYSIKSGNLDWVSASQECFEQKAQLLSINNNMEENILEGNMFKENLLQNVTEVWTSGVSLKKGNWTWFGAGESVNQTILDVLETANTTDNTDTLCMIISWDEMNNLTYSAIPCMGQVTTAVCEVRVYTQTWYVWATTNWLQILFLFTLVLLIISSCVTVQIYSSRPRLRGGRRSAASEFPATPPPYTPHDMMTTPTSNKTTNKYTEKGKELLAKIVFYRNPEDKQKLTTP